MEKSNLRESGNQNEAAGGSTDQHEGNVSSASLGKQRHTLQQIQRLEGYFTLCHNPNEEQRRRIGEELGLEPRQIKFWFQNRRSQLKALIEKEENDRLRQDNERLNSENKALADGDLKNIALACSSKCRSEMLELENQGLRNKLECLSQESEESTMIDVATKAMLELTELLQTDEPLWMRCPSDLKKSIHRESYKSRFPKPNYLKSSSSLFESSKDSAEVNMSAPDLVKLFMHPTDWVDLFPTIITKANTLQILDSEHLKGSLHVMYEEMHNFSPLVLPREFAFLRYCIRCDASSWVIVDVSYDCCRDMNVDPSTRYWKHPSGCKIQTLPDGNSKVTWVEHIEVVKGTQTRYLSGDLVCTAQGYGAKTWLANLQRICHRFQYLNPSLRPTHGHDELEKVINIPEGRRSVMKLSNTMVKNFCEMLTMKKNKVNFPHLGQMSNNGVQVSISGVANEPGQYSAADRMIISAAASFWLPLSCPSLFNFFTKKDMRPKWDLLLSGNHINEVARIPCGDHPRNCISILQPSLPNEREATMIFQESGIDSSGAYVIYSPIEQQTFAMVVSGQDPSHITLQPSGITISSSEDSWLHDCRTSVSPQPQDRSLVTLALEVLIFGESLIGQNPLQSAVKSVIALIDANIQKIKTVLDHSLEMTSC